MTNLLLRKIIHIDMDCFYAAVEIRDNQSLANKPVAVGGSKEHRGVLCTCNYIARKLGIHSAMSTTEALRICPELVVLPVNMDKYKSVSLEIQQIFKKFTHLVEPLSLDEAYLDVSDSLYNAGSATLIATEIRKIIWNEQRLVASAGISINKLLAKIASGWNKPNGMFIIRPEEVASFIADLPVNKLFGVGNITAKKLYQLRIKNCSDLQQYPLAELRRRFGKRGVTLFYQARGIDLRSVEPNITKKSLSVEHTFTHDIINVDEALIYLTNMHQELELRLTNAKLLDRLQTQYLKIIHLIHLVHLLFFNFEFFNQVCITING